jgi:hypothetical protein
MMYKYGAREPNQERMGAALPLSELLTGDVPVHPLIADHLTSIQSFQLYQNDKYAVCGPAAIGNQRILISTHLGATTVPSTTDVFDLYHRSSAPQFTMRKERKWLWSRTKVENDNGVILQEMCDELLRGGIAGVKAVAFAKVDVTNLEEVAAAVSIFGSVLLGLRMTVAQHRQISKRVFDYWPDYAPVMGHAVLGGGYDKTDLEKAKGDIITWGKSMKMTRPFMERHIQECWVIIWPENLGTKQFQQGIDLDALKAAYYRITDRELVLYGK